MTSAFYASDIAALPDRFVDETTLNCSCGKRILKLTGKLPMHLASKIMAEGFNQSRCECGSKRATVFFSFNPESGTGV
jgi:hypothetical protein